MNRRFRLRHRLLALSSGNPGNAATYHDNFTASNHLYVATTGSDTTGDGSEGSPYRTLSKADTVVVPNSIVHVAAGDYTATAVETLTSGTAGNRIYWVSTTLHGARLMPPSTYTGGGVAWRVSSDYITVSGFQIDGLSQAWRGGLRTSGESIDFRYNEIHHVAVNQACDSNGGTGLGMGSGAATSGGNYTCLGNVIHHCGVDGCGFYHGIYMAGYDYTVKNNLLYANNGGATLFANHDCGRGYIINNTVTANQGPGILCSGNDFDAATAGGPWYIFNNIVYDVYQAGVSAGNIGGIGVYGTVTGESIIAHNYSVLVHDIHIYMTAGGGLAYGNITAGAPGFVNYQADGSGDYHLTATSALVDAGTASYAPSNDLENVSRPLGSKVDMGCYEEA